MCNSCPTKTASPLPHTCTPMLTSVHAPPSASNTIYDISVSCCTMVSDARRFLSAGLRRGQPDSAIACGIDIPEPQSVVSPGGHRSVKGCNVVATRMCYDKIHHKLID